MFSSEKKTEWQCYPAVCEFPQYVWPLWHTTDWWTHGQTKGCAKMSCIMLTRRRLFNVLHSGS